MMVEIPTYQVILLVLLVLISIFVLSAVYTVKTERKKGALDLAVTAVVIVATIFLPVAIRISYENMGRPIPFSDLKEENEYTVIAVLYETGAVLIAPADNKERAARRYVENPPIFFKMGDRFIVKGKRVFLLSTSPTATSFTWP